MKPEPEIETLGKPLHIGAALARIDRLRERLDAAVAGERAWRLHGEATFKRPHVTRKNIWAWALSDGLLEVEEAAARGEQAPAVRVQGAGWFWIAQDPILTVLPEALERLQALAARACGGDATRALTWALTEGFRLIEEAQRRQRVCMIHGVSYVRPRRAARPGVRFVSSGHAAARAKSSRFASLRGWARVATLSGLALFGQLGAVVFLRSTDGADADDGSTWALADATLAASLTAAGAGGTTYTSDNHAETQATAITATSPGTAGAQNLVLCVDDTGDPASPTALATTGSVSTTGNSNITLVGYITFYGLTFSTGSGSSSTANLNIVSTANAAGLIFDTCVLKITNTNVGSRIGFGAVGNTYVMGYAALINSDLIFSSTSQAIILRAGTFTVRGGRVAPSGSVPGTLVSLGGNTCGVLRFVGTNIAPVTGTLVADGSITTALVGFENCKLGASVALTQGTPQGPGGVVVYIDNSDSADTQYRMQRHSYEGDVYSETTILRLGGASNGTTPLSWKMVSSANRALYDPLYSPEIPVVVTPAMVGIAQTARIQIVNDGLTLTDGEIWAELEYPGTSGFPVSSFLSDRVADILATPANQANSTALWTTTGLSSPVKQELSVTFTPQEIGVFRLRVALARSSATVYVDPCVDGYTTPGHQYLVPGGAYINGHQDIGSLVPTQSRGQIRAW